MTLPPSEIERIRIDAQKAFPITDTSTFSGLMQDGYVSGAQAEAVRGREMATGFAEWFVDNGWSIADRNDGPIWSKSQRQAKRAPLLVSHSNKINSMTPAPIPEWFVKWAIEQANKGCYPNNHPISTYIAAASAAYRLLSSQGLRWVKASTRWPDNPTVNQFFTIRPIKEGFDFFMFLRYVRDWDIKDTPTFRWNLWDGFHGWTHRITPDLLPKIEWLLDESHAPIQ